MRRNLVEFCQRLWNSEKVNTINILVIAVLIIGHLMIPAVSIDIDCNRSLGDVVDCELVRNTFFYSKKPLKIEDVRTVNIYTYGSPDSQKVYSTEFISSENRSRTFLLFFFRYQVARETVHTLNDFLRSTGERTLSYSTSNIWGIFLSNV